jgi:hypothetical protein
MQQRCKGIRSMLLHARAAGEIEGDGSEGRGGALQESWAIERRCCYPQVMLDTANSWCSRGSCYLQAATRPLHRLSPAATMRHQRRAAGSRQRT